MEPILLIIVMSARLAVPCVCQVALHWKILTIIIVSSMGLSTTEIVWLSFVLLN